MSYPPPPAAPLPSMPAPETMPGSTKGAVVLLWIMFGFGICGGVLVIGGYAALSALESRGEIEIPSAFMPFLVASIIQVVVWTVLRGVFAVRIAKRSAGARKGAIILELIGLGLTVLSWIFTPDIEAAASDASTGDSSSMIGAVIGIAIVAVMIGLLSTQDSKRWCDR